MMDNLKFICNWCGEPVECSDDGEGTVYVRTCQNCGGKLYDGRPWWEKPARTDEVAFVRYIVEMLQNYLRDELKVIE